MSETAQQRKDVLELEYLPDQELLTLLNEAEDHEASGSGRTTSSPAPQFVEMTPDQFREALLVESVGLAFKTIRREQGHTTRSAAQEWRLSAGRISQMEQPGANLELATVADLAQRMGYRTRVVFEPVGGGPVVSAPVDVKR